MVLLFPWKPLLSLLLFLSLFFYEHWISIPSCNIVPNTDLNQQEHDVVEEENDNDEVLKVMLVANLLLLGSDTSFFNLYFRDYYMSKVFKKSFYSLKPDMLLVIGDVSARGSTLTRGKWVSVLHQFHGMLGPFIELPFHVVLGDMDVGGCSGLDSNSVYWIARSFPGLDSSGCGAFDIDNVSFVSLNAVALLCGNNKLRFSVEKAVEMERIGSWMDSEKEMGDCGEFTKTSDSFGRRKDLVSSGLGPVLLLHFPLHRAENGGCKEGNIVRKAPMPLRQGLNALESSRVYTGAPYELWHTIPPNATQYIFQALKPRIVFSAHTHEFCDHTHSDGTREITVPSMTWKARDDPGFVFATFRSGGNTVSVSYCSLARESHVLIAYTLILFLLITLWLVANKPYNMCLR
ncbi:hypothetical protein POPTR_002G093800v4 [Populus trichocarpa]|uniref:Uncharacterized protein n=2 Tax=Populus trichocarpa TaxID=3694 RepID=U5GSH9_POPTR|nr:uncharacterized protein LOC7463207 isoform X1 [Populus trichocarpa]PNT48757.1 hypothetical protein POPTR_002G093800v4 [Populus trichocarpa]|eukprot:XP_006386400.1 metallophosphoesterase 1 isoform X1 [Populus trichocarpa]